MTRATSRSDDRREALEFERISGTDLAPQATAGVKRANEPDDSSQRPTVSFRKPTIGDLLRVKKGQV